MIDSRMRRKRRPWLNVLLSIAIGVVILGAVFYFVGWRAVFREMSALGVGGIAAVLGTVILAMVAWVICWWIILRSYGIRLPLRRIIGARLSGYAVSYLTPTLYFGGEPVRALLVSDKERAPATRVFATIIVERFLGGLSMITFILMGSFYAISSPTIAWSEKRILVAGVAFITFWILVGLINFAWNRKWISRAIRLLPRLLRRWKAGLERAADKVSETEDEIYRAFTEHWRATLLAFLVQTLATFFIYMRPQVFFFFSAGITFTFPQLSLLFVFNIMLSFFLWITPGGLGTGEAALIGIFHLVHSGVTSHGAVAYSLIYKFAEAMWVGGGLYYLAQRGIRVMKEHAVTPDGDPDDSES